MRASRALDWGALWPGTERLTFVGSETNDHATERRLAREVIAMLRKREQPGSRSANPSLRRGCRTRARETTSRSRPSYEGGSSRSDDGLDDLAGADIVDLVAGEERRLRDDETHPPVHRETERNAPVRCVEDGRLSGHPGLPEALLEVIVTNPGEQEAAVSRRSATIR